MSLPPTAPAFIQPVCRYTLSHNFPNVALDRIAATLARVLSVPVVLIVLDGGTEARIQACYGVDARSIAGNPVLAPHQPFPEHPLVVADTLLEPRLAHHTLVQQSPFLRMLVATPLRTARGLVVGSLSVGDVTPRALTPSEQTTLLDLAATVVDLLDASSTTADDDQMLAAIRECERFYHTVAESIEDIVSLHTLDSTFLYVSSAIYRLSGYTPEEVVGTNAYTTVHPDDRARVAAAFGTLRSSEPSLQIEWRRLCKDGCYKWCESRANLVLDQHGAPFRIVCVTRDISSRKQVEAQLEAAETKYRALVELSPEAILVHKGDTIVYCNPAAAAMLGAMEPQELLGASAAGVIHPALHSLVAARIRETQELGKEVSFIEETFIRRDGRAIDVEVAALPFTYNGQPATQVMFRDITERKRTERIVTRMAYYDALTGLPNRTLFHDRLWLALTQAERDRQQVALLFLDLDRFKLVNDSLGHDVGDHLLQLVAQRLLESVREGDTVARMGGDEFTVILPKVVTPEDVAHVAGRIFDALSTPIVVNGHPLFVSVSIGVSLYPTDGLDPETLLKQADTAMYSAKEQLHNTYRFYRPQMDAGVRERLEMEHRLRIALEQHELEILYQPRIQLRTRQIVGVETLLQWRHPTRGPLVAEEFIQVAEETGLIVPIGDWLLRSACVQARRWQQMHPTLRIAVNLTARQFQSPDVTERIATMLADTGVEPACLQLEVAEGSVMWDASQSYKGLHSLKMLGVQLVLDGFGTGYASLSTLKRFPLETLKIDRSLVAELPANPASAVFVEALIKFAHTLKLAVTAEGVETEAQAALLAAYGCDDVQGSWICPPLPSNEVDHWLIRSTSSSTMF